MMPSPYDHPRIYTGSSASTFFYEYVLKYTGETGRFLVVGATQRIAEDGLLDLCPYAVRAWDRDGIAISRRRISTPRVRIMTLNTGSPHGSRGMTLEAMWLLPIPAGIDPIPQSVIIGLCTRIKATDDE
jgi:hypothetical protein